MSSFHFCLSTAKNRSSFQLLPASLVTIFSSSVSIFLWYPIPQTMWKGKFKKNFHWLWWIILWQVLWKAYLYTLKWKAAVSYILFPMLSVQNWSEFPTHVEHNFHAVLFNTITCTWSYSLILTYPVYLHFPEHISVAGKLLITMDNHISSR
jgi:hypothetical protein